VASAAGIADQGQISKLLMRLQNLGLIRLPDWLLTQGAKGVEVERSILMESASG
jgi:hypothetical protein